MTRAARVADAARKLLLLLVSLAFGAALAEALLRIFFSLQFASIYELDPRWLHRLVPGSRKVFVRAPVNGWQHVRVEIDRDGYRGPELQSGAQRRVVVYGDSFIEGEFSEYENTFAAQLGARLTPVEMVNAGVVAYGPDQIDVRMQDELPRLRPALAVIALYADNDFGDLLRDKLFRLGPHGELVRNSFTLGASLRREFAEARSRPLLGKLLDRLARAADAAWRRTRAPARRSRIEQQLDTGVREYRDYVLLGNNEVSDLFGDHYDADVSATPDSDSARYKVGLMEQVLLDLRRTARERGVGLLLVLIPSAIDVVDGYDGGAVDPREFPRYRRSALTGLLEAMAQRASIPCVNLFGPFRARDAGQLYFHGGDHHWNDAGQQLAAGLVADFIRARQLLDPLAGGAAAPALPR